MSSGDFRLSILECVKRSEVDWISRVEMSEREDGQYSYSTKYNYHNDKWYTDDTMMCLIHILIIDAGFVSSVNCNCLL